MYTILDTETTGLNDAGVVQIAWLVVSKELEVLDSFCSLVNPEKPIEEGARLVHGISDDDVVFAPTLHEVCAKIPAPFNLFAFNAPFDARMIAPAIKPATQFCVLKLARQYVKGTTNHKLETLQKELSLPLQKSHDALGDVHTTLDVLKHCLTLAEVPLETLIARQAEPAMVSKMPFGKYKGTPMLAVPLPYRKWLLGQADLSADLRFTLERLNKV